MRKGILMAVLRVLAGALLVLALAATIGIPAGKRGPAAAEPGDGRKIALAAGHDAEEVWALENILPKAAASK